MVSLSSFFYLLLLQQMLQVVIACNALQFILHNLLHLLLDAPVICLHHFLHAVVAVLVREVGNDGNRLVGTFLPLHLLIVKDGAVVIDVGIHRNAENKLCGDVDFDSVVSKASHITPVKPNTAA